MPPKERREEVGSRSASHTPYCQILCIKTNTGRPPNLCLVFLNPFSTHFVPNCTYLGPQRCNGAPVSLRRRVGSRSASHAHCRLLNFRAKNRTGRPPILCLVFFGNFSFPNSPFRSQLYPFRTPKVQRGTCVPPPPGWLKKCFARTLPPIGFSF